MSPVTLSYCYLAVHFAFLRPCSCVCVCVFPQKPKAKPPTPVSVSAPIMNPMPTVQTTVPSDTGPAVMVPSGEYNQWGCVQAVCVSVLCVCLCVCMCVCAYVCVCVCVCVCTHACAIHKYVLYIHLCFCIMFLCIRCMCSTLCPQLLHCQTTTATLLVLYFISSGSSSYQEPQPKVTTPVTPQVCMGVCTYVCM